MAKSNKRKVPWNSRDYIVYGFLVALGGAFIAGVIAAAAGPSAGTIVFVVVAVLSGLWLTIGLIGKGVAVGMREHAEAQAATEWYLTDEEREERKGVF